MGLAKPVSGLAASAKIQATNFWGNFYYYYFIFLVKGFATLNIFVRVGRKHYLISAWLVVTKVLNTLKNSVWALYPKICLSCLVKVK